MTSLLGFAVFLAVAALLVFGFAELTRRQKPYWAYRQTKPLSEVEQILYWRLVEALPECVILCQVTFSRFMRPDTVGRRAFGEYMAAQNKIAQKSIDFLVCLKDFTVVAAVELDDATHITEQDVARDQLLESAGINVLRMHVREIPSAARIRELFAGENTFASRVKESDRHETS